MLLHVLFEHAAGYALFAVKEVEEIGMLLPQVGPFCPHSSVPVESVLRVKLIKLFACFRWRRAC